MRIFMLMVVIAALVLLPGGQAEARPLSNTLTVSPCDDAHFEAALSSALIGDTIVFNCGGPGIIPILSTKVLNKNLTIDGNNGGNGVTFSGANARRVFSVTQGSAIVLNNMTIRDGLVSGSEKGGGILNMGALTLNNVTLRNNSAGYFYGSGIYSNGSLTVMASHILSNTSEGILHAAGSLNVQQSIIAGNTTGISVNGGTALVNQSTIADNGTGISSFNGTLNLLNSTVSGSTSIGVSNGGLLTVQGTTFSRNTNIYSNGAALANIYGNVGTIVVDRSTFVENSASGGGSALFAGGTVTVTNSTFAYNTTTSYGVGTIVGTGVSFTMINSTVSNNTNNSATSAAVNFSFTSVPQGTVISNTTIAGNTGRGLAQSAGNVRLANSIVAENSAGNCAGTIINGGNNLNNDGTCPGLAVANVQLGPLANNGGPTLTRLPNAGSPALDKINPALCPPTDQRGVSRPMPAGGLCDIGSVERQPIIYLPFIQRAFTQGW